VHTTFETHVSPGSTLLVVSGDLDVVCSHRLRRHLADAEDRGGHSLDLDAGEVSFVDCTSLRLIDSTRRRLARHGSRLRVTAASSRFRLVSDLAGYVDLAPATDQLAEATGSGRS
jgi:anti-anti-sigma factor